MRLRLKCELFYAASAHEYEVRPRNHHRGVDLISEALPFGRLWYGEQMLSRAIAAAKRSLDIFGAVRVKDASSTLVQGK
jgi:hypothetical protein